MRAPRVARISSSIAVALLLLLLLLLCGCIYLMSMNLLSIAFALGPVFLPWLLLRPASFLFDGWLRFTLVAALYQVVGIIVVTLLSRMHEPVMEGMGSAIDGESGTFNFYYFVAAFLLSGVSAMLMLQVPSIANALVNGSIAARFSPAALASAMSGRVRAPAERRSEVAVARGAAVPGTGPGPERANASAGTARADAAADRAAARP